jgi:uncharacterized Fe-S cluster protein YjdI
MKKDKNQNDAENQQLNIAGVKHSYTRCKVHSECRKVKGNGSVMEIKKCPWCDFPVSTNNIGKWCAGCYTLFKIEVDGYIHFSKKFQKTQAEAWAIALNKVGGMAIGEVHKK